MKLSITFAIPFLAILICPQVFSAYSGTRYPYTSSNSYDDHSWNSSQQNKTNRTYEVVIKLEDAFGKAANDIELIKELSSDMKIVKRLIENMAQDVREIKRVGPHAESLTSNGTYQRSPHSYNYNYNHNWNSSSTYSPPSSSSGSYKPRWEVALPKINCAELRLSGVQVSGIYTIQPNRSQNPFEVYCDMVTDGGGWTVFQRRGVLNLPKLARENFYRNWEDYETGFGNVRRDYWLGLEKIHFLTSECTNELIVNLTSWDNVQKFARYGQFYISGSNDFYRLTIANYTGNAGDGLLNHNKMKFSTYDKQNDFNGDENCAQLYHGAYWYKDCFWSNLNGEYADDGKNGVMTARTGIEWGARHFYSYMQTEMKIRPRC